MRLYDVRGKLVNKDVSDYKIEWDEPCRSIIQFKVKQFLKPYWLYHICYEEFPVFGRTRMRVDMINATLKISIEVNGKQHNAFNPHFHNKSRLAYLKQLKRDEDKREWLEKNDFKIIEIEEEDIKKLSKDFFKEEFNLDL